MAFAETKTCVVCEKPFAVEEADLLFYEKVKVPPPTFCFNCRVQRRTSFRNERVLHRRKCDFPGHNEELISIFPAESSQRVYDHGAWWGDGWDPLSYGREIDWSRPFLSQVRELWQEVPDVALMNINPVNSDYCSITEGNKNCYLVFGGDFNEDTLYSTYIFNSRSSLDTYWVQKSEFSYETVDCTSCNRVLYSRYAENCYDSAFLFDCRNCHDCLGCVNLSNASYQIFNVQYSKEDYFEKLKEFDLSSRSGIERMRNDFNAHALRYPRRSSKLIHSVNSTGDNLENCKNCIHCFDVFGGAEELRHTFLVYSKAEECMDVDRVGLSTQLCYDSSSVYPGSKVMFSRFTFSCHDVQYSYNAHNSAYLFGSVGIRNKQYCILNKQYSKEDYEDLVPKIIEHMKTLPYVDAMGRSYAYGEFFPSEFSPFAYNETLAAEMFPLSKIEAQKKGFFWRDIEEKKHQPTLTAGDLPDRSVDIPDSIVNEVIECEHWTRTQGQCNEQCSKAFKIVPAELQFYRQMQIPLPVACPSCRHFSRIKQRNPLTLYPGRCACAGSTSHNGKYKNLGAHIHKDAPCVNEFQTTYAPDRPEIVYCEQCYQAEVV